MTIQTVDQIPDGADIRSTVGVVGGGAAGIALALRLAERGIDCVVCESGADDYDQRNQDLYDGEANGYFDLTATRLRQFGGSTNHFAGQSRPLGQVDFLDAPWRPGHSWPIAHEEFAQHLPDAATLLGLVDLAVGPDGSWASESLLPDLRSLPSFAPGADTVASGSAANVGPTVIHQLFQLRAQSMSATHRDALASSARATVIFGLNAVEVVLAPDSDAVERIALATLDGRRMDLRADVFVIASGGIESARLLLASTARSPDGVGNGAGLVGRYFADHPGTLGIPMVRTSAEPLPVGFVEGLGPYGDAAAISHLGISDADQIRLALPGFHARLSLLPLPFPDLPEAGAVAAVVDAGGAPPPYAVSVHLAFDAIPNPDSRVTLGAGRNELGEPTASLSWRMTDDDEVAMAATVEALARWLARAGVGRMATRPPAGTWRDSVIGQHHHMGTLRMSGWPSGGVVDPNLRFHEVPNLYAVGSAVFPTYGHVNPTLNIVALALRLADHLAGSVAR